jgi:MGT family glycosyltransferase
MQEEGHVRRMLPLARGIVGEGLRTVFYADSSFETLVRQTGAEFADLFAGRPLDVCNESFPRFLSYLPFATRYAPDVLREVERHDPAYVVYDTLAIIGRVVANDLGIPYVNVCLGHNANPAEKLRQTSSRARVSQRCQAAGETLGERLGLAGASPLALLYALSPHLNIACEPSAYLTPEERQALEPVAFYGSLLSSDGRAERGSANGSSAFPGEAALRRVYVSFGTVVWRWWPQEALAALSSIADALAGMDRVSGLISLGGAEIEPDQVEALSRPNVAVASWVDQQRALEQADVFITHHGLSGTHEAVLQRVPMISYPFSGDQPGLAEKCRSFGIAIPLTDELRGPLTKEMVEAAFRRLAQDETSVRARLEEAHEWELETIAGRGAVHRRIIDLTGCRGSTAAPAEGGSEGKRQ